MVLSVSHSLKVSVSCRSCWCSLLSSLSDLLKDFHFTALGSVCVCVGGGGDSLDFGDLGHIFKVIRSTSRL